MPGPPPIASPEWDEAEALIRLEGRREFAPTFIAITLLKSVFYSLIFAALYFSRLPRTTVSQIMWNCAAFPVLAGLACGCIVSVGQMLTPIRIGSSGIRVRKLSSFCLRWDEISEIREWRFLLFSPYLTLKTLTSKRLSLPAYLIHRADFTSAILTHAPADNRLRRYLDGAQS